jgi:hypothetical protein
VSSVPISRSIRAQRSGGKRRCPGGRAAYDVQGPGERDPVRVDVGGGRRPADQGGQGVVGEQVGPDLLVHEVRQARAQDLAGATQVGLELIVSVSSSHR